MILDPKENCINCIFEETQLQGGLFIGNIYSTDADIIESYKIKAVISIMENNHLQIELLQIPYLVLPMTDLKTSKIDDHFKATNTFIEDHRQNGNVLVQCLAGNSRSVTISIAYLIGIKALDFEEAFGYMKQIRKTAKHNIGFIKQLKEYEKRLKQSAYV